MTAEKEEGEMKNHHPYCAYTFKEYKKGSHLHPWNCLCGYLKAYDQWNTRPTPQKSREPLLPLDENEVYKMIKSHCFPTEYGDKITEGVIKECSKSICSKFGTPPAKKVSVEAILKIMRREWEKLYIT